NAPVAHDRARKLRAAAQRRRRPSEVEPARREHVAGGADRADLESGVVAPAHDSAVARERAGVVVAGADVDDAGVHADGNRGGLLAAVRRADADRALGAAAPALDPAV